MVRWSELATDRAALAKLASSFLFIGVEKGDFSVMAAAMVAWNEAVLLFWLSENFNTIIIQRVRRPYYRLQAAEDGSVDEHLADLDVDGQAGQVVSQRGQEMVGGVTRSNLPQQVDSVADWLRLRGIQSPTQEVLRGPVLAFLPQRETTQAWRIPPRCGTVIAANSRLPWYEGKAPPGAPAVSQEWSNPWRRQTWKSCFYFVIQRLIQDTLSVMWEEDSTCCGSCTLYLNFG